MSVAVGDAAPTRRAARLGGAAWVLSAGYLVVEALAAGAATGYGLDGTVSDLAATTCVPSEAGRACSPGHPAMNGAFVVSGLLIAAGAVLVGPAIDAGRGAVALLVVVGLSAAAVGLVPVDRAPGAHVLVAAPTFVARDVALVVLAVRWRRTRPRAAAATALAAVVSLVGAVLLASDLPVGITERLALYPAIVWLAVVGALVVAGGRRAPHRQLAPRR